MASARLTSGLLVSALIRRVQSAGGFAAVLHRGDETAGAILIECVDRGERQMLIERATGMDGQEEWRLVAAAQEGDESAHAERLAKRRRSDPDLWLIELDIAQAERFAAEILSTS